MKKEDKIMKSGKYIEDGVSKARGDSTPSLLIIFWNKTLPG